jgi:Zn-dependent peptidase ImmA (M78 family)
MSGIDDRNIPDLLFVLNELRRRGMISNYCAAPDESMRGNEARFDSDTSRFTVAHEIGHILLKHEGGRYRGQTSVAAKKYSRDQRIAESEANRWASAFWRLDTLWTAWIVGTLPSSKRAA